jgi:hypothetical protein
MKPDPSKVEGRKVVSHEFSHQVEHKVQWSHVLLAIVLLVAIVKLGPVLTNDDRNENA